MPKAKFNNRLSKLFTDIGTVNPEPLSGETVEPTVCQEPEPGPSAPAPEEPASNTSADGNGKHPAGVEGIQADSIIHYAPDPAGWGEFLDGIRRREQIGYAFDQSEVKDLDETEAANWAHHDHDAAHSNAAQDDGAQKLLDAQIQVSGEEIGKILLEADPERQWTAEDQELVDAVAQQLAQQIETLRLLDEAQRSRSDAEQALFRLERQNGHQSSAKTGNNSTLSTLRDWKENGTSSDFEFSVTDDAPVQEAADRPESNSVLKAPIRVGEELLGQLQVEGEQVLQPENAELVETVAQRLAKQVENLRLLEESRHFRNETEDAIRRLTYQSWQAYLAAEDKANLGFCYDESRVLPLGQGDTLEGEKFPLRVHEEVIGQLAVESQIAEHEEVSSLINVISDRLSAHLDGLRLAEQREQALAESETLYGISAQLSTAQSLEDALASVSEPAREAGARDSRLFFISLDEHGQPEGLTLAAIWYPEDGSQLIPVNAHFQLGDYPTYRQILKDPFNPLIVSNVSEDDRLDDATRQYFINSGARAVAVLPLSINGRWVGVIFINWEEPHTFSGQESRLYTSLGRQAAVVVNNRLLLEQTRKRAQELQTVAQVSTAASTILDPQELLQTVVDLTRSSFSLYHAQVYMLKEREEVLEVVAGSGDIGRQSAEKKLWVLVQTESAVARAARQRQVVIVNDVQNELVFIPNSLLPDVRSEMALPMIVGDRLLGVFNVQANTVNRFTREDARIYTTLASQVAVALQNAELYAEQAATVERLRELDHLKSAFLANMSHELRTPLNSILGFAEVLLLGLDGPINDTMTNDIRLIEKNGKHLLSLINDVLDMAKIEAGKMNLSFEKFMLRELMEETLDITSSLAREKSLYLVIDPESQDRFDLVADRVRIRQVLINVVANAVKFTEKGGITIRVVQNPAERKLQIQVKDTGIGVPQDKLEQIFESFSQVDTSTTRKAGGTGLGLPISRRLVEMHGGRLWAESSGVAGEGSLFIVELPFEAIKQ